MAYFGKSKIIKINTYGKNLYKQDLSMGTDLPPPVAPHFLKVSQTGGYFKISQTGGKIRLT